MNNKLYYARVRQEKVKLTDAEKKADKNFMIVMVLSVLFIICYKSTSCKLNNQNKPTYANTNVQPVLQK